MGITYSYLESEKKTWIEHTLVFDRTSRGANLNILKNIKDETKIYLTHTLSKFGGITYEHWFVTDLTHFIEFGNTTTNIYDARVTINTNNRYEFSLDIRNGAQESKMCDAMRNRISHVLGMSNYSLCLRNCEHVANYIFRGRWISSQMDSGRGIILNNFRTHMLGNEIRLVNTFPSCIRPHIFDYEGSNKLYSFLSGHYEASRFDYYLDSDEDTYNILIIGPTGAGKSHLINVFFNQAICESKVSHHSVTREIYFIRGSGKVYSVERGEFIQRKIIVADTIGLCDTEWDEAKIINLIKGRVSANFKFIDAVYIVFRADRLLKQYVDNIKRVLNWLSYEKGQNLLRFQFVGTYADYLNAENKDTLRKEATKIFGLKDTSRIFVDRKIIHESLVYTGFPPEDTLNEMTKERVKESWKSLRMLLTVPGMTQRISISQNESSCSIL